MTRRPADVVETVSRFQTKLGSNRNPSGNTEIISLLTFIRKSVYLQFKRFTA